MVIALKYALFTVSDIDFPNHFPVLFTSLIVVRLSLCLLFSLSIDLRCSFLRVFIVSEFEAIRENTL